MMKKIDKIGTVIVYCLIMWLSVTLLTGIATCETVLDVIFNLTGAMIGFGVISYEIVMNIKENMEGEDEE